MYRIVRRESFSPVTFLWEVLAPDVARAARAGQFLMVRLHEGSERIPLTVADSDPEKGTITLVVQAVGKSTYEMRDWKDDAFEDFIGPMGEPSRIEKHPDPVVLVGGGLGVAPVYPVLKAHKKAGNQVIGIIGFRTKSLIFWEERFRRQADELLIATDDGSFGEKGFVSQVLQKVCASGRKISEVFAIGPLPMMKACAETTRPFAIPTMISVNSIMVDGTGMCGSCRVTVGGEMKFACVDGPDFDAHKVDFAELEHRQKRFFREEKTAMEMYHEQCRIHGPSAPPAGGTR